MSSSNAEPASIHAPWGLPWQRSWLALFVACLGFSACRRSATDPHPQTTQERPPSAQLGTSLASLRENEPKPGTRLAISEHCSNICARSAPLGCVGASECQSFCEELATSLECRPQMAAVLDCFAEQATEHWQCSEQGLPALKEGRCVAEQAAYRDCRTSQEPATIDQP